MRRKAFTIIEVLVSVVLIAIVALGAVKLQQESRTMALYLSDRSKSELSNTLFLGTEVTRYHKDEKDAYTLLSKSFKRLDDQSRTILRESKRNIFISDPISLSDETLPIELKEVLLKGTYSSRFLQFKIR